jgi:hypothetical protein
VITLLADVKSAEKFDLLRAAVSKAETAALLGIQVQPNLAKNGRPRKAGIRANPAGEFLPSG